jgi:hypothetical protein
LRQPTLLQHACHDRHIRPPPSLLLFALYDPNIVAEHYLDYLVQQLSVESTKQFKKLTHPDAKSSFTHNTEKTVLHRFANSIDMLYKSEPSNAFEKGIYGLADAWR